MFKIAIPCVTLELRKGINVKEIVVDTFFWGKLGKCERNVLLIKRNVTPLKNAGRGALVLPDTGLEGKFVFRSLVKLYNHLNKFITVEGIRRAGRLGKKRLIYLLSFPSIVKHELNEDPTKERARREAISCRMYLEEVIGKNFLSEKTTVVEKRRGYLTYTIRVGGDDVVFYDAEGNVDRVYSMLWAVDEGFKRALSPIIKPR